MVNMIFMDCVQKENCHEISETLSCVQLIFIENFFSVLTIMHCICTKFIVSREG